MFVHGGGFRIKERTSSEFFTVQLLIASKLLQPAPFKSKRVATINKYHSIKIFSTTVIIIIMASTFFFLLALAASAAARPSNSSSIFTKQGELNEIDQNSPLILDDIRFVDEHLDKAVATANSRLLWPGGRIPYVLQMVEIPFTTKEIQLIQEAMLHITTATGGCVTFIPRVSEKNYINIYEGEGCHSELGMKGGRQTLSLGYGCLFKGTIIHELCHALGLEHEQIRPDRDEFITVNLDNVIDGQRGAFTKLNPSEVSTSTSYDYHSIMHYGRLALSKNRQPTMTPKASGVILKEPYEKSSLTRGDAQWIKTLYKC